MEGTRLGSGWELQKENIMPLSSGRNMALLKNSVDTSMRNMTEYEEETDSKVRILEDLVRTYNGSDPLEPWLILINFLENTCLLVAKLKAKLNTVLKSCTKQFWKNPLYIGDKRYIDMYIKSVADVEPARRIQMFQFTLRSGVGITCSLLYLAIAELQEKIGKDNEAVKTLREGIQQEAKPNEQIKDALSQLEYRVAQRLAHSVLSSEMSSVAAVATARNFGSSVPVYGPCNEAPAFRTDLETAVPVTLGRQISQSKPGPKPIEIFPYNTTSSEDDTSNRENGININPVETDELQHDEENKPRPSKWNNQEVAFESESTRGFIDVPRERLQLYVDPLEERSVKLSSTTIKTNGHEGGLRERKLSHVGTHEGLPDTSSNRQAKIASPVDGQQSLSVLAEDRSSSIRSFQSHGSAGPQRMMCSRVFYSLANTKPISFEQRHRDRWVQKHEKSQQVNALNSELEDLKSVLLIKQHELDQVLVSRQEQRNQFDSTIKKQQNLIEQLEYEKKEKIIQLKSGIEKIEKHYTLEIEKLSKSLAQTTENCKTVTILLSEVKLENEKLTDALGQMKLKNEELSARLLQQAAINESSATSISGPFSAEGTFVPPSLNLKNEDTEIAENDVIGIPSFSRADVSDFLPPPMAPKKMTFNLYESHMDSFSNVSRMGTETGTVSHSRNRIPSSNEENRINLDFRQLSENIPPTSVSNTNSDVQTVAFENLRLHLAEGPVGKNFRPSVSRPALGAAITQRSTQIYAENGNETEVDQNQQVEETQDFNLSNLTRALAFRPEPLLNSTPERVASNPVHAFANENGCNYYPTQRIQTLSMTDMIEGPNSPSARERARMINETRAANNLSPIQETSKESRSNCTTSSSTSGNMTSTKGITMSGTSLYNSTHSARSVGPRCVSRLQTFH